MGWIHCDGFEQCSGEGSGDSRNDTAVYQCHLGMLSHQYRPLPIYQGPFLPAPVPSISTPVRNPVPRPCSSK